MNRKNKSSWPMISLGIITLILSSYGLFELAHIFGKMPAALAVLAVAGFDVFAIASGVMAFRVAKDGDSPALWNSAVVLAAFLSAGLQYVRTQLGHQPVAVGVMMGFFPLATVALFEGTLRRSFRLSGRRSGRVAPPRASFELLQWLLFRRATWEAFRDGVRDRTLSADAAFKLALIRLETTVEPEWVPDQRREIEIDYTADLRGKAAITSGSAGGYPEDTAESPESVADSRPVSVLVREFLQVRGADDDGKAAVLADVLAAKPGANPDTVRRTITRESALRSA
jgi:hypothetical protein